MMEDKDSVCVWWWDARYQHWRTGCGKYELDSPRHHGYWCPLCHRRISVGEPK